MKKTTSREKTTPEVKISTYMLINVNKSTHEKNKAFYFRRYQHSMADIILFQFWLLEMYEHLIMITKADRRSPRVVSV